MAAKALMSHDAKNKAAAAENSRLYQQKLGIKRQLQIKQSHSRQAIADADRSREDIRDAKAHGSIKTELDALVAEASIKASGLAQGQSTDGLLAQAKNTVLQGEAKFLRDMDKKMTGLRFRDREIQQNMEMAWLEADARIKGTSYVSGPGAMGLAMGLAEGAMQAYTFGQNTSSSPSLSSNYQPGGR
jgi:hypothetical protein